MTSHRPEPGPIDRESIRPVESAHEPQPGRSRHLRVVSMLMAGLSAILVLALIAPGIRWFSSYTDAAWTESDETTGTFQALTLGPIIDLNCVDSDSLLGIGNSAIQLTWKDPVGINEDVPIKYRIEWSEKVLGLASKSGVDWVEEGEQNSYLFKLSSGLAIGLSVNVSIRPVIGNWEGAPVTQVATGIGLLFPLLLKCDGLLDGVLRSEPAAERLGLESGERTTEALESERTTAPESSTSEPPDPEDGVTSTSRSARTSSTASSTSTVSLKSSTTKVPTSTAKASTTVRPSAVPTPETQPSAQPSGTDTPAATTLAIVIPDEPRTLSALARIEDVKIVMVGEDELVVVEGTSVPTDARAGAAALEIWLAGGSPDSTWEPFASTDPERDGWRWAAISQKTGTIVYIR